MPLPRANRRVAPLRSLQQLPRPTAPAVDPPGDMQRASVITPSINRDIAARRSRRSSPGKSQNTKQQRNQGKPDQEGFTPPPPDRASAATPRQAR